MNTATAATRRERKMRFAINGSPGRLFEGGEGRNMTTKHTPGPWRARKSGIYDADCTVVTRRHEQEKNHVKWAANAQLIAAAPELLAVVRDLLDIVVFEYNNDPEREDLTSWRRAIDSALAAIEKAEGV